MDLADKRKRADFKRRFNEYLVKWLKENHRTQKDFCAAADVNKNTVTNWKKGTSYPQDAQLMRICEVFEIDPRALAPFYPLDKNVIDNSLCIEWSEKLQQYADEKGLNEDFYQYFISKSQFIRKFPFHRRSSLPFLGFAPVKYQFMDDNKQMIMMQKEDIDFLIELQSSTHKAIDYLMYRKRQEKEKKRIEDKVDLWILPYNGQIERAEVLRKIYALDLTKEERPVEDKKIFEAIDQIAEEKGIKPRYKKSEVIAEYMNNPLHDEEWKKSRREWGRIYGKEAEAEKDIREAIESDRQCAEEMVTRLRKAGLLDEETEV